MRKLDQLYQKWLALQPLTERKQYLLSQRFTVDYNFNSHDFESCIRNAVSISGDSDTIAAMAGGIAQATYGLPKALSGLLLWITDARASAYS